jgi:hypothetical protein
LSNLATITVVCSTGGSESVIDAYDYAILVLDLPTVDWLLRMINTAKILKAQDPEFLRLSYIKYMFEISASWEQVYDDTDVSEDRIEDLRVLIDDCAWTYLPDAGEADCSLDIEIPQVKFSEDTVIFAFYPKDSGDEVETQVMTMTELENFRQILYSLTPAVILSPHEPREIDTRVIEIDNPRS